MAGMWYPGTQAITSGHSRNRGVTHKHRPLPLAAPVEKTDRSAHGEQPIMGMNPGQTLDPLHAISGGECDPEKTLIKDHEETACRK